MLNELAFTESEECAITTAVPLRTAQDRFREKLLALFRDPRFTKSGLASYVGKESPSWTSNLLVPRSKRLMFTLEDLQNIADYFSVSLGELLGAAKPGELAGDEQRLIHAYRALNSVNRGHVIAVVETMSLAVFAHHRTAEVKSSSLGRKRVSDGSTAPPLPSSHDLHLDPDEERLIAGIADEIIERLDRFFRERTPRQRDPGPHPRKPDARPTPRPTRPPDAGERDG